MSTNINIITIEQQPIHFHLGGGSSTIIACDETRLITQMEHAKLVIVDSGFFQSLLSYSHDLSDTTDKTLVRILRYITDEVLSTRRLIIVPGGEQGKGNGVFDLLLDTYFQHGLIRSDTVLAIGGGALCDTVAFVTSVYMRGISLVLVPSTLLAMVDASIGGKTAINYKNWKNMVGTFYPAEKIMIVPPLLQILSPQLLCDGLIEALKAGMLRDEKLLSIIETYGKNLYKQDYFTHREVWSELIWRAVQVKVSIVEEDFKENGIRAFLNLGHTFAHAHEACAKHLGHTLSHGEAVGLGIRAALLLGLQVSNSLSEEATISNSSITDKSYAERIFSLLDTMKYPKNYTGYDSRALLSAMTVDKKKNASGLRFILQHKQGATIIEPIDPIVVIEVLQKLNAT